MNRKPHVIKADQFLEQVAEQFPPAVIELTDGSTILIRVPLGQVDQADPEFFEALREAPEIADLAVVLGNAAGQDGADQWRRFTEAGYTAHDFAFITREATREYEDRLGKFRYAK